MILLCKFPTRLKIFYNKEGDNLERFGIEHYIFWEKSYNSRFEIVSTYQNVHIYSTSSSENTEPVRSIKLN